MYTLIFFHNNQPTKIFFHGWSGHLMIYLSIISPAGGWLWLCLHFPSTPKLMHVSATPPKQPAEPANYQIPTKQINTNKKMTKTNRNQQKANEPINTTCRPTDEKNTNYLALALVATPRHLITWSTASALARPKKWAGKTRWKSALMLWVNVSIHVWINQIYIDCSLNNMYIYVYMWIL